MTTDARAAVAGTMTAARTAASGHRDTESDAMTVALTVALCNSPRQDEAGRRRPVPFAWPADYSAA
jgi:hypothetical protein